MLVVKILQLHRVGNIYSRRSVLTHAEFGAILCICDFMDIRGGYLKFYVISLSCCLVHWCLIQKVHAVCRDELASSLTRCIDRSTIKPWLLRFDPLKHSILPDKCFLSIDGPSSHHHIFFKKLAPVKGTSDGLFHVVVSRVHGAVPANQSVDVLLHECKQLSLAQARPVWGHEAAEDLDQKGLQLLDKVELGAGPIIWLLKELP